ncbi:MAG TPA: hypothetical protein VFP97_02770 [Chitinophagaceae bacterium]|nr:hypothetical protein [Chitinophagaceae bacterium]
MKHSTSRVTIMLIVISIATVSCTVVGTLNPIYTNPKDFIIKKELVGKWIDPKDVNDFLIIDTFVKDHPKSYRLSMVSKTNDELTDTTHFIGHLVNNGGSYFLECWYEVDFDKVDLLIPRHFIAKISFIGKDKIEFAFPDAELLIKLINEKKLALNYAEKVEGDGDKSVSFLITNKSSALRYALTEMKKYPELFRDKITLVHSE